MLHVSPTYVQFKEDTCEILLENQSNCAYNVYIRSNNTTAYRLQKIEFQIRPHEKESVLITRAIDRHIRQGDAFYVRYQDPERETRQHEICLYVVESKDSHFLKGERDKLYLDQSLSNLEDLERQLKDQKNKLESLYSSYELQKKHLQTEKKHLEQEFKMCQRQYRAVSSENLIIRLQNHLNIQNLTLLGLMYIISFLLVIKW